jgi:hypothetical protein
MTMQSSSPSFFGMKKIGETNDEVPCLMQGGLGLAAYDQGLGS